MAKTSKLKIKLNWSDWQSRIAAQFKNLNPRDPSSWPSLPRYLCMAGMMVAVIAVLWFVWLDSVNSQLTQEQEGEIRLKEEFVKKLGQAINIDVLKKQREQVQQYVIQLERQLPSKAEMDALLSDINQAGLARNLQFELFRPGQINVKEYYAELPINLRVAGRYHDIGAFTSDIANLSRIVTLSNLSIGPKADGTLVMDATAKTFRYLDLDEIQMQKKASGGKK